MRNRLNSLARRLLPLSARRQLVRAVRWPPVGAVDFGSLRRIKPISSGWGFERGQPVDRYYIERFLSDHASEIRGRVLEVADNAYTLRFGKDRVSRSDVLHVFEAKPPVTIVGSLTDAEHIPAETYDCIILTQTLQTIFDVAAAVRTIFRILKPGGVVLATVPGISKVSRYDMDRWGYHWSFTTQSVDELFSSAFPRDRLQIESHGNVLTAIAFLHGLASCELTQKELDYVDHDYQVLITVRAARPESVP